MAVIKYGRGRGYKVDIFVYFFRDETAEYSSVDTHPLLFLLLQALLPHIMEKTEQCHQRKQLSHKFSICYIKNLI